VPSRGRLIKILVGLAVSAALLVYFFWDVDLRAVAARLRETRWSFLALCAALNVLALWLRAWRWYYLYPPGTRPSHLFNATMIGYMANNLLPLRAGELVRVYVASRRGQRFWTTVATLVVERVLDALAVGLTVVVLLLVVPFPREMRWSAFLFLALDLTAMAVLAVIAVAPGTCAGMIRALFSRWRWVERRLLDILSTMSEGLRGIRAGRHLAPVLLSSVGIWLVLALAVWAAFQSARLAALPLTAAWTVLAFLGLGVSLPSSPGFVGVVQAATVLALDIFGVPRSDALSVSILLHAAQFIPVTLLGLALLLVEHVSLGEATRAAGAAASPPPAL
jgi:uncharacterized protein (TIRG00374 family)